MLSKESRRPVLCIELAGEFDEGNRGGVPQAEAYLVYVAGIPTLCGVLAGLAETSAERPNRVGRVIGFLPVWGLDVDVECAVIIRGDGMASAQNIRHSG